ncbi:MAG: outer membrane beta-barrel protein [Planctomycetota bacterium]|nr:outer membrane beta-barrel protein [Planctomycetota bacterium]MDA1027230.1 outer membrane beta-barrel protein [Planctomycetota bacterium]
MKPLMIAAAAALTLSSMVSADALALITQDADEKTPPPPTETAAANPWYAAAAFGGNFLLDAKIKDTDGIKFKFKNGLGLNIGVGYQLCETLAVEVRSGLLWNEIKGFNETGMNENITGGDGDVYQIPLMASLIYSIPISEKLSIGLKAGVGIQWTDFNASNIEVSDGVQNSVVSYDHTSTAFRWEVGFQLANQIAHNVRIGGGVLFSGTSSVSLGTATVTGGAAGADFGDDKLEALYNVSLGFGVIITF